MCVHAKSLQSCPTLGNCMACSLWFCPAKNAGVGELPTSVGSTVVKIPGFHYRGYEFDPWVGNQAPTCHTLWPKKKKKKILKRVAMPSSRGSSPPRDRTHICMSPALAGGFFTTSVTWEAYKI